MKETKTTEKRETTYKSPLWRSKNEIQWEDYTPDELLDFAKKAKETPEYETVSGRIIKGTLAFQDFYEVPFDYSQLSNYLETELGAVNGWHFPDNISSPSNEDDIITIQEGRLPNTKEFRHKIDAEVEDMLVSFLKDYKDVDKSKIVSEILKRGLGDLATRKANGEKVVKYPAQMERFI